jgi:glycosyltransferase involved in cell wall biosynthesis
MTIQHSSGHHARILIRTRSTGAFRTASKDHHQTGQHVVVPHFSVIICTYNRRNMVLTALASLHKQTLPFKYFEVVVVDNGSIDGTFAAVQTYLSGDTLRRRSTEELWRTQCLLESRNGLAYARNTGVAAATGEIMVFLDDDVIVDQHFLAQLYTAYEETHADAIGGSVELHWEAKKPYWLTNDMLDFFGYYMPFRSRTSLPTVLNLGSSCFSVKREALDKIGGFSPFLTKRLHTPINVEIADLCRRLRQRQYTLWYEPTALVVHRVARERLKRPFLIGRAYWQGRSEILAQYANINQYQDAIGGSFLQTVRSIIPELLVMLEICLLHRSLLYLARKSMSERIYAAMRQAKSWGRIQQQFILSNHAPATIQNPFVLLVQAHEQAANGQAQALIQQGTYCTTSVADIPLAWLWRHRAYPDKAIGIIHFHQPGAFNLNIGQRLCLLFKLWLAQRLGLRTTSTDAGGWWHNVHNIQSTIRCAFERRIFAYSHKIYTFTRQPERFYREQSWWKRTYFLPHPGLHGTFTELQEPASARHQLGIRSNTSFVFLCFAHLHTEREITHCIAAFAEMRTYLLQSAETSSSEPQLLLVGTPKDKRKSSRLMKLAAFNPAIHLFLEYSRHNLPLYIAATNAAVMPYLATQTSGIPEMAMLLYSHARIVISPNLPRLHGILPPHAGILYTSGSHASLVRALLQATQKVYQHTPQEAVSLDYQQGWKDYARYLLGSYQTLLTATTKKSREFPPN